jgi:hypothetical protein
MFKTVVLGSQAFTDARTGIDDAIKEYNSAIADLTLDIGITTQETTVEVLKTVLDTKKVIFGSSTLLFWLR